MTMCNLRRKTIKLMNHVLSFLPLFQHTHRVNIFVCSLNFIYLLADLFVVLLIYTQMRCIYYIVVPSYILLVTFSTTWLIVMFSILIYKQRVLHQHKLQYNNL